MSSTNESRTLPFSFGMRFVMILMTVICIGLVTKTRFDRWSRLYHAANAWIGDSYRQTAGTLLSPTPCPIRMEQADQLQVLEFAVLRMGDRRKRMAALRLLIAFYPQKTHQLLRRALPEQKDPAVLAAMLRIFGLQASTSEATALGEYLDHRHAKVRAAAADAIGCVFSGQLPWSDDYGNDFAKSGQLNTVPPILVTPLLPIAYESSVALPSYLRRRLETMLTRGETRLDREAAGRALQSLPPL